MKILVTGFEAFGNDSINPSKLAIEKLEDVIDGVTIEKMIVEVSFDKAIKNVYTKIQEVNPDVVLMIGQAAGRKAITPERIAINIDDASIADNDNQKPVDKIIYKDGKNAYFSTLPIKKMVEYIEKENIPASISNSAGTYVCNHLMYGILYHLDKYHDNQIKAGFMHVPYITEQVIDKKDVFSLSLDEIIVAIKVSLRAIIDENKRIL